MATSYMETTETRILKTLAMSSFLFMAALLSYSYFQTGSTDDDKKQKILVLSSSKGDIAQAVKPIAPNTTRAKLVSKKYISPDTVSLDFRFVNKGAVVPVGKHVKIFCANPTHRDQTTWNAQHDPEAGKEVIERKYTPVNSTEDGFVLVVKSYCPNDKFCNGGKVSQYLANLKTDEEIEVALPFGIMEYLKQGQFKRSKLLVDAKFVGMLAGGSGITPMYRLLESSLSDPSDTTKYSLVFANRGVHDILLREKLDKMMADYPNRFKVTYTLTRPPQDWKGETGLITKEMIKACMPPPSPNTLILCCGPPQMIKTCCKENLEQLGYAANQVWDF